MFLVLRPCSSRAPRVLHSCALRYMKTIYLFIIFCGLVGISIWVCGEDGTFYFGLTGELLALCAYLLLDPLLGKSLRCKRLCGAMMVTALYSAALVILGKATTTSRALEWRPIVVGVSVGIISAVVNYKCLPALRDKCGDKCCKRRSGGGGDHLDGSESLRRPLAHPSFSGRMPTSFDGKSHMALN